MRTFKVKEVREITGLTRKQLYDYQTSIPPVSTENDAGYKLYDQEGVNRLALAAMLSELGAGPAKINSIFGTDDYDVNNVLDTLIDEAKRKRDYFDDIITVAEYLRTLGAKNDMFNINIFQIQDLHSYATYLRKYSALSESIIKRVDSKKLLEGFRSIFSGFKAVRSISINQELINLQIDKLLMFFENELKINGFFGLTAFTQSILIIKDLSERIDKKWGEGFSGFLSESILNYQLVHFSNDFLKFSKEFEAIHKTTELRDTEYNEVSAFLVENIKKWFGYNDYNDIFVSIKSLSLLIQYEEIAIDPDLKTFFPHFLQYLDEHRKKS